MTKKEKILISLFQKNKKFSQEDSKELLKFLHTVNDLFDNISPFSWFEKHGEKITKNKIKKLYGSI